LQQVLQEQLKERERERIRTEEQQECERLMMLKEMERIRQEELRQQVEKKLRAQQLVAEVGYSLCPWISKITHMSSGWRQALRKCLTRHSCMHTGYTGG
jgi:predicted Holliday junction resolvase-like endonuclease